MPTIYRKTAKGQAEIATREHRLPPRLRGALIVVDGQRSASELAHLVPGDAPALLQQLLADGFIEVFAVLAERPPAPPPAAAPAKSSGGGTSGGSSSSERLEATKREAVRFLNDKLGPAAEGIAIKIERCKGSGELQPLIDQAATLLRNFGERDAADAFAARFAVNPTTR